VVYLFLFVLAAVLASCSARAPSTAHATADLAVAESLYADLRDLRDQLDIALAQGRNVANDARPFGMLALAHNELRRDVTSRLATIDSSALTRSDARAFGLMRRTLGRDLDSLTPPDGTVPPPLVPPPSCDYEPQGIVAAGDPDSLRTRLYACYGWAQSHVVFDGDTLDRLTILGTLSRTPDAVRRRRLFLALEPVWRSVNADNRPTSPYRQLVKREARNRVQESPAAVQARASGVPPDSLERWLLAMLEAWRAGNPDSLLEPWDWYYSIGRASRILSPRISSERLLSLNAEVYRALGADPKALRVHYDITPREGKTPVAYTTFGARPRFVNGGWRPGEPWIFATYRVGGLDNLNELLHETGHAVHIAAIRTRPAFANWPDSDPFTEAVADFIALEVYEPAWQLHWLGDSVSLADGLRGRYGGIVMDVAWALFEMRMQRDPAADPNQVWTALTRDYLRIRPHPELSWWAMRGQLIDAPGYMMNYAAGAILIAAIRARTRELHGWFTAGDSTWYGWVAPRLYRFGLERPTREVIEEFLGGPVTTSAILKDMGRMRY
jgi:hypothetical protein